MHRVRRLGVGQGADAGLGTGHLGNNSDAVTTTGSDNQGFMQDQIIASHMFWWTHGC